MWPGCSFLLLMLHMSHLQSSDEDTDCSSEEDGPVPARQPLIPLPSQPGAPSLIQKLKLARGSDSGAKAASGSIPAVWGSGAMHSGTQLAVAGRQLSGGHLVPKLHLEGNWHSTAEQRERLAQVRHSQACARQVTCANAHCSAGCQRSYCLKLPDGLNGAAWPQQMRSATSACVSKDSEPVEFGRRNLSSPGFGVANYAGRPPYCPCRWMPSRRPGSSLWQMRTPR